MSQGRFLQNAGLFRIDPGMTWGNQLISNDAQGGYYRLNYQSRQLLADVGIDEVRSVSGLGSNTTFLTGDLRYQLSRDWGAGGVANASHSDGGTSWSWKVLWITPTAAAPAEYRRLRPDSRGTGHCVHAESSLVHAHRHRLSTSASVERISGALSNSLQQDSTVLSLAAFGGGQFTNGLGIEGNVRWARAVQGQAAPGVSANVSLTWQVSSAWDFSPRTTTAASDHGHR
jgi:hypothetical protein